MNSKNNNNSYEEKIQYLINILKASTKEVLDCIYDLKNALDKLNNNIDR